MSDIVVKRTPWEYDQDYDRVTYETPEGEILATHIERSPARSTQPSGRWTNIRWWQVVLISILAILSATTAIVAIA